MLDKKMRVQKNQPHAKKKTSHECVKRMVIEMSVFFFYGRASTEQFHAHTYTHKSCKVNRCTRFDVIDTLWWKVFRCSCHYLWPSLAMNLAIAAEAPANKTRLVAGYHIPWGSASAVLLIDTNWMESGKIDGFFRQHNCVVIATG